LGSTEKSEKFQKLLKTTKEKKNGILEFSGENLDKYAKSARDFSLVVLLTTDKNSKIDCQLCPHINIEYTKVATQFHEELGYGGYNSDKFQQRPVFFGRCDIMSCMDFYKQGNFQSFPLLLHLRPSTNNTSSIEFHKMDKVDEIFSDPSVETMATHLSRLTGHNFVQQVPLYKIILQYGGGLVLIIVLLKLAYTKLPSQWKINPMVLFAASVCVFAFVMAGTIFNSIHSPAMYYKHPVSKQIMLIYPSTRHQFVLEGIIMSSLFTLAGLFFVGFTSHVPTFKDPWKQRGMFVVCALGFYTCFWWIMTIFKVKNGFYPYW